MVQAVVSYIQTATAICTAATTATALAAAPQLYYTVKNYA
jgi:hypothetical protein